MLIAPTRRQILRLALAAWCACGGSVAAEQRRPDGAPDLAAHPHPRLLFPAAEEKAVLARIADDPAAAALHREVLREAEDILDERTCRYEIPDGRRLLRESRRALHHIVHAGMAWRLTGDEKFRRRVILDLDAACRLRDWNPSHFLDTAEMAAAVAIGYDWLYPTLGSDQRKRYETALLEKALLPAKAAYDRKTWWSRPRNNWSQVCATGIGLAALAVWEREPELCERLFLAGVSLVERSSRFYHPDGVYVEGPGYWRYGTNYHVLMLAACESIGHHIAVSPTIEKSGDFMLEVAGPSGLEFNFADMPMVRTKVSPSQLWIARHFGNASQAAAVRAGLLRDPRRTASGRLSALGLLWMPEKVERSEVTFRPLQTFGGQQPLAFLRSGPGPEAAWLAIKGGTGAVSHGHLDAGSFVHDAGGVRWFVDLGGDSYSLPGYFSDRRWDYFRLNNWSHNTLVINRRLQEAPERPCPLRDSGLEDEKAWAEFDLSGAYTGQAGSVVRRAVLNRQDGAVEITDTIERPAGPVRWAVMTDAEVELEEDKALLRKGGQVLELRRHGPAGGRWLVQAATPHHEQEKQNDGYRLVSFTAPAAERLVLQVGWRLVKE